MYGWIIYECFLFTVTHSSFLKVDRMVVPVISVIRDSRKTDLK